LEAALSALVLLIFLVFALPASAIDMRDCRIPDLLVFPGFAAVFLFLLNSQADVLSNRLAAALLSGLFFFIIRRFTGALGLGDVKFSMLIGLCCGLPWACAAFLVAAVTGIAFILIARRGEQERRKPLPFAPFLSAGVIAAFIFSRFLRFF
jgi:prepilin signal peptidase PulO-like enzyme (type II secretory pathway)